MSWIKNFVLIFIIFFCWGMNAQMEWFSGRVELGGDSDCNSIVYISVGKYIAPNWYVGIGVGNRKSYSHYAKGERIRVASTSLMADTQYNMFKNSGLNPFVSLQTGVEGLVDYNPQREFNKVFTPSDAHYKMAVFFAPSVGVKLRLLGRYSSFLKIGIHWRTQEFYSFSRETYVYSIGFGF